MKKFILTAVAGAAALALGACNSNEAPADDTTVVDTETPAADELAAPSDAATDASAASTDAAADAGASPAASDAAAQ